MVRTGHIRLLIESDTDADTGCYADICSGKDKTQTQTQTQTRADSYTDTYTYTDT